LSDKGTLQILSQRRKGRKGRRDKSNYGSFFLFYLNYWDLRRKMMRTRGLLTSRIPRTEGSTRPPRSLRLGENKFE